MADQKFDFSDLPAVKAENEGVLIDAGIDPSKPVEAEPAAPLSEQELGDLGHELEMEAKYGDSPVETALIGAAGGASFSLSDRALIKSGLYTEEELGELKKRNPTADLIGQTAGIGASLLVPGLGEANVLKAGATAAKTGLAAKAATTGAKVLAAPTRAAVKAGQITEQLIGKALTTGAEKAVTKSVLKKSIERAAGGAVEGAAFGLNDLLREEAIGEAELNAENLLTGIGTGALYGGLIGGAIPIAGSALRNTATGIGAKAKPLFDKVLAKYADPRKAAQELSGLTPSKLAKLESNAGGKELLDNLPQWYVKDVGLSVGDDGVQVLEKVLLTKKNAAKAIEQTLEELDIIGHTKVGSKPGASQLRSQLLHKVADDVEAEFLAPYADMKSLAGQNRKVRTLIDDIRFQANKAEPLTGKDLVSLKRKVDKVAGRFYERPPGGKPVQSELAAFKARDLLNKASHAYAEFVDPKLAEQLKQANRNFHYATTVEPYLLRKSIKDPSLLGFKDALYGLVGAATGDLGTGLGVVAGKKFLESDMRRKLLILGGLEKANLEVAKRIGASSANFLGKGVKGSLKLASIGALVNSPIAHMRVADSKSEAPKTRMQAYNNAARNLAHLTVQSDELLNRSIKAGASVGYAAPKTAQAIGERAVTAIQFLQSKIPKRPYEAVFPSDIQKPYEPSSMELAKFERYVQVVDNPLSVLQDLEAGTLTQEHVEALRVVYPNLYSRIKQEVLSNLANKPEGEVPYRKKVQISILFQVPVDGSLTGRAISGLQSQFADARQAELTGSQGGQTARNPTSKVDPKDAASKEASDTQAFQMRRNAE